MLELFRHPQFLPIAAAAIAVPIVIHLINRLRFKRIRWAAMEFLLKAQKRNRRRLVIEQLLLLALRCFLVALVGLLVLRFVGVSFAEFGIKQAIHIVLLDDSLSMGDRWKHPKGDGYTNSFEQAKEILTDKIAKTLRDKKNPDQLVVMPLSSILYNFDEFKDKAPKRYDFSESSSEFDKFARDMRDLQPTKLALNLVDGVKQARKMADDNPKALVTITILSDYRKRDWEQDAAALHKELVDLVRIRKAKVTYIDTVGDPWRTLGAAAAAPPGRPNVGIIDLRPRSRMVGKDMPVTFTLSVINYGPTETEVDVDIFDVRSGQRVLQVDFIPRLPLKLKPREITQTTFEIRFPLEEKDGDSYFAALSARLKSTVGTDLEKDGLQDDNVAYGVVEVRRQVPVLIVDGAGMDGYKDQKKGRDSFFLEQAYRSVPGSSSGDEGGPDPVRPFRVDLAAEMGKVDPMSILERSDLRQYPAIILCNVPQLSKKQLEHLEKYVAEGGGLGVFMGPLVNADYYNKFMYKDGKGIFPAKLKETYFPPQAKPRLDPQYHKGVPMMHLRDDDPSLRPLPIFGAIFPSLEQRYVLDMLPVYRYFQVESRPWIIERGDKKSQRVVELATLANDEPIEGYQDEATSLLRRRAVGKTSDLADLLDQPEFRKYSGAFAPIQEEVEKLVNFSQKSPHFLAVELERILKDRTASKDGPAVEEFWTIADPRVQNLKAKVEKFHAKVRYGDGAPFILMSSFGKGKVVTVLSTAGGLWNGWPGGNLATASYQPFIWEMQNFLSAQGADINLTLGNALEVKVDAESFNAERTVMAVRTWLKEHRDKAAELVTEKGRDVKKEENVLSIVYPHTAEPGVYFTELVYKDTRATDPQITVDGKTRPKPLIFSATVFNVDTMREGNLDRVPNDVIKALVDKGNEGGEKRMQFTTGAEMRTDEVVPTIKDLSESPWLFLLFLTVLVAEQALAVHLSFHLKQGSEQLSPAAGQVRQAA